ncbi:hypothetical protein XBJ2_1690010 [Xenorhabdus bovienii str. Jollieti]|uniref:Uncharacterized protein n=1 Tax=Xenorhabdus bovienii (strain SS-2004) TaxID=406818 RepID=D3V404_XENBS|nr:hypothetical protein XBJ1_3265 [Xenorhabdus bovienii SS-2004]CDH28201.1 hypothetical protein XBJ2_1690010 [Xenorhabdus bovienii str. Jollieti]
MDCILYYAWYVVCLTLKKKLNKTRLA